MSARDLPCFLSDATLSRISTKTSRKRTQVGLAAHSPVPWDDNRLLGDLCDVLFRRSYLAVDAASGRVVDEGVIAVPESVADMNDVGLRKVHVDVRVRVSGQVLLKHQSGAVGVQSVVLFEDGRRNRTRRRGWESVMPPFNTRVYQ